MAMWHVYAHFVACRCLDDDDHVHDHVACWCPWACLCHGLALGLGHGHADGHGKLAWPIAIDCHWHWPCPCHGPCVYFIARTLLLSPTVRANTRQAPALAVGQEFNVAEMSSCSDVSQSSWCGSNCMFCKAGARRLFLCKNIDMNIDYR